MENHRFMITPKKTREHYPEFRVERAAPLAGNYEVTDAANFPNWREAFKSFSDSVLSERDGCRWTITEIESGTVCAIVEF